MIGNYLPDLVLHLRNVLVAQFESRSARAFDVDDKLARDLSAGNKRAREGETERKVRTTAPRIPIVLAIGRRIVRFTATTYSSSIRWKRWLKARTILVKNESFAPLCETQAGLPRLSPLLLRRGPLRLDEARAIKRHNGHGHDVRSEERKDNCKSESRKQIPAHAVQQGNRKEDDRRGECRGQDWQLHFPSARFCRHLGRFSHLQMAKNVFENDNGVIDQAGKGERQTGQNHGVDRSAAHANADEGGQRGQRNGQENRESSANASQKEQDHQSGQAPGRFRPRCPDF